MKNRNSRSVLVSAAAVMAFIVVAFLFVQDQRHGWPFSPHHVAQAPVEHSSSGAPNGATPVSAVARAAVQLPAGQIETLGVQFEPVEVRPLHNPVRAVATVVVDESRIAHVHTRVAGWLEALYVNTTGQSVRAGQPLAAIFSQELYSSQNEYLSALRRAGSGPASVVLDAARTRLEVLGMNDAEIAGIEKTGEARRLVTITAPRSGIVLNRGVSAGTAVDPSTEIVTLADLSQVWVIAEVAEADAAQVSTGATATLNFPMSGRDPFAAMVEFVYPTLTERTRTVRVRLPVPNRDGKLRPGMYGNAEFSPAARTALTVSRDAVIDTGESQHVFVHTSENMIEPRKVKIGARLADRVEILQGLTPGDHVVTSGVFLIDSESRLRASGGTGHSGHGGGDAQTESARGDRDSTQTVEPAQHAH
jgi:Cu(I)/Ag(I) efflux system membrane fusion protein